MQPFTLKKILTNLMVAKETFQKLLTIQQHPKVSARFVVYKSVKQKV